MVTRAWFRKTHRLSGEGTYSRLARHILTHYIFTRAWLNDAAKWQLTFNRRTRVVDEERSIESSAVEKVEFRA